MASFPYLGGHYDGNFKRVRKKKVKGKKATARQYDMIPHGSGVFTINGMRFEGRFRNGFEDVGKIIWPDGTSYFGSFRHGYPEPSILQDYHRSKTLKDRAKQVESELILKQAQLEDSNEDLNIEKETTMNVALALDRCQAKLRRVFEYASELEGVNVAELHQICFN